MEINGDAGGIADIADTAGITGIARIADIAGIGLVLKMLGTDGFIAKLLFQL